MSNFNRREFGLAALGLAAASSVGAPALAGPSTPKSAEASIYQTQLGRYKLTAVLDGIAPLDRSMFFGEDAAEIDAVLGEAGIAGPGMPAPVNAFLLQAGDQNILIDAGMGDVDILGPGFGRLTAGLAALGVSAEDITHVIVTHAHPDHIGGLLSDGQASFRNAEIAISETEYRFWTDAANAAAAPEGAKPLFALASATLGAYEDRLVMVQNEAEVAPGLRLELSPGHTPGHSVLHLDGGDQELLFVADTVHSVELHTALPETGFGFDVDPTLAAASRAHILDRTATDAVLIAGAHVHFPGFGRFRKSGDAYSYIPASWL